MIVHDVLYSPSYGSCEPAATKLVSELFACYPNVAFFLSVLHLETVSES